MELEVHFFNDFPLFPVRFLPNSELPRLYNGPLPPSFCTPTFFLHHIFVLESTEDMHIAVKKKLNLSLSKRNLRAFFDMNYQQTIKQFKVKSTQITA